MIAKSHYKSKFEILSPFMEEICRGIKKEIKQEFIQKGLIRTGEYGAEWKGISQFFCKKIEEEEDEKVGEWVASSWICRHGEIFQYFHEQLSLLDKQYDHLVEFPLDVEEKLKRDSLDRFGCLNTYLFCVLNSVVFSLKTFEELKSKSLEELISNKVEKTDKKISSIEEMQKDFEKEKQKLEEKYEKRLQGILKKHQMEVEGYRKQIGQLQKKLETVNARV